MKLQARALNLFVALDQFLFCWVCLGQSYPNETASACAWRMEQEGRWQGRLFRPLIDVLALLVRDPDHCRVSFENMHGLKFMPPTIHPTRTKNND